MKSIISKAIIATAVVACLGLTVQAKSVDHSNGVAVSDTGKMKMKKMSKKKMDKMKMKKMKKDTSSKM